MQDDGWRPGRTSRSELIRIRDIGEVDLGYVDPPTQLMRFNGREAIGISITNVPGANVVDVGRNIDERLDELIEQLPIGIEVERMHWMSDAVSDAVNNFVISFAEAVGIVLVVLALAMGWRMGLIIGSSLIVTILGSFVLMSIFGIDLQRMSLGALVIALGMMVDNAIVVADGMAVRIEQGMDRVKAALEAATQPSGPLAGRHCHRGHGLLPDLRVDRECGRILRHAVLGGRDLALVQLGGRDHADAGAMHRSVESQQGGRR